MIFVVAETVFRGRDTRPQSRQRVDAKHWCEGGAIEDDFIFHTQA